MTRFDGRDADALRRALLGRPHDRARRLVVDRRQAACFIVIQLRAAYRFLRRDRQRFNVGTLP